MRVLIIKISSMGDILHTLPALTDATQAIKNIQFDWVVEEQFSQIPTWHPAVRKVIPIAIRRWRKNWFGTRNRRERTLFYNTLQSQYYDIIIDAQGLLKSAFLVTRLAQGTKHGFNWQCAREPLASLFYQYRHNVGQNLHAVEKIRRLFNQSLNYPKPKSFGSYALQLPINQPSKYPRYCVFVHATTQDNKHWPIFHWRDLIKQLSDQKIEIKLPWGTAEEKQRALTIAKNFPQVTVLPKLSLSEIAQVLHNATIVIAVDTGLAHLAAALNRPTITLYGPTDPKLIGSYGKNQTFITAKDKKMSSITPAKVLTCLQKELI